MLTIHDTKVWDTGERIDLVVPSVDERRSLVESGACVEGDIDGSSLLVAPGLTDPHVHFRDPGQLDKETMVSGASAAAAGGYTRVLIMPNTLPAADGRDVEVQEAAATGAGSDVKRRNTDSPDDGLQNVGTYNTLDYLQRYEQSHGIELPVRYDLSVCASLGRAGRLPTNPKDFERFMDLRPAESAVGGMARKSTRTVPNAVSEHPLRAISDDGSAITDKTLDAVLTNAKSTGLPILEHCEHHDTGAVNEGAVSRKLGLPGIPSSTELSIVTRDIEAARRTGVHIHFQHVSTASAFDAIRAAKAEGLPITCETAPHYLALCDKDLLCYGSMAKMNPPLRSEADRKATIAAVADGTVDMIATDHAPHTLAEKQAGLAEAPNGIIGLECAYGVCRKVLVESGAISEQRLIELMSLAPERLMGHTPTDVAMLLNTSSKCATKRVLDLGKVEHPESVDLTLIDTSQEWTVDSSRFHSKGRNTPFDGWKLTGRPMATIIGSKLVFSHLPNTTRKTS
ncbi:dihydroorotase [Bifidobacterium sp. ESL0790]|uniref:dihydroorotase n=1 Tax=Bifidobacterium sp. ESL0790 TaxID=2983233 RepID=UPI0023F671F4|nr:dihydroorotase [Bifidobacterium sp. ESL0790]WEV71671.1 dihydroorotase [Bifidobacterium sp. ESL0790]